MSTQIQMQPEMMEALSKARGFTRASNTLVQIQVDHLILWAVCLFQDVDEKSIKIEIDFDRYWLTYTAKPIVQKIKKKTKKQIVKDKEEFEIKVKALGGWVQWLLGPMWTIVYEGVVVEGTPGAPPASPEVARVVEKLRDYSKS